MVGKPHLNDGFYLQIILDYFLSTDTDVYV